MADEPHPAIAALLEFFDYQHLPPELADISRLFHSLAHCLAGNPNLDGPELTVALRKLLEAKDCAVRARMT